MGFVDLFFTCARACFPLLGRRRPTAVDFRIHYATAFGQSVCVVGSGVLGAWLPSKALNLRYNDGWWRGRLLLPRRPPAVGGAGGAGGAPAGGSPDESKTKDCRHDEEKLLYKYVLRMADGSLVWEGGINRTLALRRELATWPDRVEVRDSWRVCSVCVCSVCV